MTVQATLPSRLHHTAYVSRDLEATRAFYEDVIGLPLVATWCEKEELFGAERVYAHCFFELADGGALAFFQFADEGDAQLFGPEQAPSPFIHLALLVDPATQDGIIDRIEKAGIKEPDTYILDHGYCKSVYVKDPNGMLLEFTVDAPYVGDLSVKKRATAHEDLKRWLAGDHTPNNDVR
jgi:catechol 2,3-dioxygenase-like lactoylglutathione lyase family enzyme